MSDIVDRLRETTLDHVELNQWNVRYEAADEIERLKAIASKAIREQIPMREEIEALRAENAKLREALRPFAVMELWTDAYPDGPLEATTKERFVDPYWVVAARAAMGGDYE